MIPNTTKIRKNEIVIAKLPLTGGSILVKAEKLTIDESKIAIVVNTAIKTSALFFVNSNLVCSVM
jgi:hypothetical protein